MHISLSCFGHRANICKVKEDEFDVAHGPIVRQGLFFPKEILPDRWCSPMNARLLGGHDSSIDYSRKDSSRRHKVSVTYRWIHTRVQQCVKAFRVAKWPVIKFLKHCWPILPSQLLGHNVKDLFSSNAILNMQMKNWDWESLPVGH